MSLTPAFVSYTKQGGENRFVWRLQSRLRDHGIEPWVYEDDIGRVPGGAPLTPFLMQKIDESELVVPIVSRNTFKSCYTPLEVEYAMQRQAMGKLRRVLPIVSHLVADHRAVAWPIAYDRLASLKFFVVDFEFEESEDPNDSRSKLSLEHALGDICYDLGVTYQPPVLRHPRLPFLKRFVDEMRDKVPQRADREIGIYLRLMQLLNQFAAALEAEKFDRASSLMELFCKLCEYEFRDTRLYYPYLVRTICEILNGDLAAAEQALSLLDDHESRDETYYGAWGYICNARGKFPAALEHYREALRRDPHDPAARSGVIVNRILCGERVPLADLEEFRPHAGSTEGDLIAIQRIRAFALANLGEIEEAIQLFEALFATEHADLNTVLHYARLMQDIASRTHQARAVLSRTVKVLERLKGRFSEPALIHELAFCTYLAGNEQQAIAYLRKLIQDNPTNRQYRIDAAQLLCRSGRSDEACELVRPLFDSRRFPLPASKADFYLDGFANWIVGNDARAEYDYWRSGGDEPHYRELLPKETRSPR